MVRLQFWKCEEGGVLFHYHYSQVHSDFEWWYLLGFYMGVKQYYLITYYNWNNLDVCVTKMINIKLVNIRL